MKVDRCPKCKTDVAVVVLSIFREYPDVEYWDNDRQEWVVSPYRESIKCQCAKCHTVWMDRATMVTLNEDIQRTNKAVLDIFKPEGKDEVRSCNYDAFVSGMC